MKPIYIESSWGRAALIAAGLASGALAALIAEIQSRRWSR